jgi:AhpD family alkylhydroperoxidase
MDRSAIHRPLYAEDGGDETDMQPRLDIQEAAPDAFRAMLGFQAQVNQSGLEPALLKLVKIRASQINGCAYCIDMHTKDARAAGETEQRIYALSAWREAPFYTERERAALEWTEALTLISAGHAPDNIYEEVRKPFTAKELVELSMAIVAINSWNRLIVGFRAVAGRYQPRAAHTAAARGQA